MIAVTANRFKSPGKVSEADWADYDTVGGLVSQDSGFYSQSDFSSQCLSLSLEENHGIIIHQVVLDIQTSEWEHLSDTNKWMGTPKWDMHIVLYDQTGSLNSWSISSHSSVYDPLRT